MNIEIPPAVFYAVATVLIVFGGLRAYHLGAAGRRLRGDGSGEEDESKDTSDVKDPVAKRHFRWGIIWVAMGIFLLVSTLHAQLRGR